MRPELYFSVHDIRISNLKYCFVPLWNMLGKPLFVVLRVLYAVKVSYVQRTTNIGTHCDPCTVIYASDLCAFETWISNCIYLAQYFERCNEKIEDDSVGFGCRSSHLHSKPKWYIGRAFHQLHVMILSHKISPWVRAHTGLLIFDQRQHFLLKIHFPLLALAGRGTSCWSEDCSCWHVQPCLCSNTMHLQFHVKITGDKVAEIDKI